MKKVVDLVDSAQHRSFKSIQRIFSRVKDKNYIPRFKKYISENGTTVQKFQKIISTNYVQDQETTKQSANEFLNNSKQVMQTFDESSTFNSDQSGINYVLTSGSTLSEEDERVTLSSVSLL